jgi:WD40 repeat protein
VQFLKPILAVVIAWALQASATLAEPAPVRKTSLNLSFTRDVAPVLQRHCVACHGPDKAKGHFRVDSFELLLRPGSSGQRPIVPLEPDSSHLYQLITEANPDDRMPQKAEALTQEEIALLRAWIANGANFDGPDRSASLSSLLPRARHSPAPEHYAHPWPVTALVFSPEGTELVASGYCEITFWDPLHGTLLRRLSGMPERIRALAWQPGGSLLAVAGGAPGRSGEVLLLDLASDLPPVELASSDDEMLCVAFSADGERLALAGSNNTVKVCDVKSRVELLRLAQHSDWIHALAFSPDGRRLASASRDRTARVHNTATGEVLAIFNGHEAPVESLIFDRQGTAVVSAGADRRIRRWDCADVERAKAIVRFESDVTGLIASESSFIVGLADGHITQHDSHDGIATCVFSGAGERVTALAWQKEQQWLAAGSFDGQVRLWDVRNGELLVEFTASPGLSTFVAGSRR